MDDLIKDYINNNITLEFLLEQLTETGACPGLINDDNGHWALSFTGIQEVNFGDEPSDLNTTFFVEKHEWKPTIKEAVIAALNDGKS